MHKKNISMRLTTFNNIIIFALLLATGLFIPVTSLYANLDTEERFGIEFPELSAIRMPEVSEYQLDNGMNFLLCEYRDFPTISVNILINGGSYFEEPEMIGLVELMADLLRTGGTANYPQEELDLMLDDMAISLQTSGRIHSVSVNMNFLAEDTMTALAILVDVLRNPLFNDNSLERLKRTLNTAISRRNDNISSVTGREFMKLIFGADNPYARHSEYDTIASITRDDIVEYHNTFFKPQNMLFSIVGDFDRKEMERMLERTFGDWVDEDYTPPPIEKFPVNYQSSINYIPRGDAEQSWITIGHITEMTQDHPDYVPMLILNSVLGGGFNSRIYQRIRNQMGLAYAPSAHYTVYYDFPGVFYLMSQTVADKTVTAIEAMIDEVEKLQREYITEEELELARESYLNSFVFNYDSPRAIVRRQLNYKFWNYPLDFLEQVRDRVYDVTVEDIHRLANDYIYPEHFVILVVGNEDEFDRPLSSLGEVNEIDISIPRPERVLAEATTERKERGKAIFNEYLEVMGDTSQIENIKMTGISTEIRDGEESSVQVTAYIEFPDRITQLISTPRGDLAMVYNRGATKMSFPGGNMALPPEFADEMRNYIRSNPINLANNYEEMYDVYLVEEKQIDDKDFYILSFNDEYNHFLLFIDKDTMLPYQTVQETVRYEGDLTIYRIFERYDEIDGVLYPTHILMKDEHGNLLSESDYGEVEFNIELPEEIFSTER